MDGKERLAAAYMNSQVEAGRVYRDHKQAKTKTAQVHITKNAAADKLPKSASDFS